MPALQPCHSSKSSRPKHPWGREAVPEIREWDSDLSILPIVSQGCPVKNSPGRQKAAGRCHQPFAYDPKDDFSIKELLMQASSALRREMPERGLGHLCPWARLWHTFTAFPQDVGMLGARSWLSTSIFQSLLFFCSHFSAFTALNEVLRLTWHPQPNILPTYNHSCQLRAHCAATWFPNARPAPRRVALGSRAYVCPVPSAPHHT